MKARVVAVAALWLVVGCSDSDGSDSSSCPMRLCSASSTSRGVAGYSTQAGVCGTEQAMVDRDFALFPVGERPPLGSSGMPVVAASGADGAFALPAGSGDYELCFGRISAFDENTFTLGIASTTCVDVTVGEGVSVYTFSEDTLDYTGPLADACLEIPCCEFDAGP